MNHNRSTALERSVKITGGLKLALPDPNLALGFRHGSKHTVVWSPWRFSNPSMDHHGKQITDKYYDETKMRTRQKQRVVTDTWSSLGCWTTPLEHWSKRKPTVEPRLAKQQTLFDPYRGWGQYQCPLDPLWGTWWGLDVSKTHLGHWLFKFLSRPSNW